MKSSQILDKEKSVKNSESDLSIDLKRKRMITIIVRSIIGVGAIFVIFGLIWRSYFVCASEQAFINADIISLRSPITGVIKIDNNLQLGMIVSKDRVIFQVENSLDNPQVVAEYNVIQNMIDVIENEIEQNKIKQQEYEINIKRLESILDLGGLSKIDYEDTVNKIKMIKVDIVRKSEQLKHLRRKIASIEPQMVLHKTRSCMLTNNGFIWTVLAGDGEYVEAKDEIIQVISLSNIYVDAFFSENRSNAIRPGGDVVIQLIGDSKKWDGKILSVRGGAGRISFNTPVAIPPLVTKRRLITARIKVKWDNYFNSSEFFGVGRSVIVVLKNR